MGLQWCPRDPEVRINRHVIRIHLLVPIKYQDVFTSMDVHIEHPVGADVEILREDDREVTTFYGNPDLFINDEDPNNFQYAVEGAVRGVPADTPIIMMIEETWNGTCKTVHGQASGLRVQRVVG